MKSSESELNWSSNFNFKQIANKPNFEVGNFQDVLGK